MKKKLIKFLQYQGIQTYPSRMYSSENLAEIEWKIKKYIYPNL